jgi:hypothetical protein
MKNYGIIKILKWSIAFAMTLLLCPHLYASPPPPPGVPLDGGISFLVIAAVGYGAHKISKDKNQI